MKTLLDTIFGKLTMWFRVLRYSIYAEFKKIGINFLEKKKKAVLCSLEILAFIKIY